VVIDSGWRVCGDNLLVWRSDVRSARISRSSATQRAGRAGRTGSWRCDTLYPAEEFLPPPEFDVPEIFRKELSSLVLDCAAMVCANRPVALARCRRQKRRFAAAPDAFAQLKAMDVDGSITPLDAR